MADHLMPEAGVEASGVLLVVAARDLKHGDVVINGYVRKVLEEPRLCMGRITYKVGSPAEAGYDWPAVGEHSMLPEVRVNVLRHKEGAVCVDSHEKWGNCDRCLAVCASLHPLVVSGVVRAWVCCSCVVKK